MALPHTITHGGGSCGDCKLKKIYKTSHRIHKPSMSYNIATFNIFLRNLFIHEMHLEDT